MVTLSSITVTLQKPAIFRNRFINGLTT